MANALPGSKSRSSRPLLLHPAGVGCSYDTFAVPTRTYSRCTRPQQAGKKLSRGFELGELLRLNARADAEQRSRSSRTAKTTLPQATVRAEPTKTQACRAPGSTKQPSDASHTDDAPPHRLNDRHDPGIHAAAPAPTIAAKPRRQQQAAVTKARDHRRAPRIVGRLRRWKAPHGRQHGVLG